MISLLINLINSLGETLQFINFYLIDLFNFFCLIVSNFFSIFIENSILNNVIICFIFIISIFVLLSRKGLKIVKDISVIASGFGTGYMAYQSGSNGRDDNRRRREEEAARRRETEERRVTEARRAEEAHRVAIEAERQKNQLREIEAQIKALKESKK